MPCRIARSSDGPCGPGGALFEAMPTVADFIREPAT
jgi:hypothetical protein